MKGSAMGMIRLLADVIVVNRDKMRDDRCWQSTRYIVRSMPNRFHKSGAKEIYINMWGWGLGGWVWGWGLGLGLGGRGGGGLFQTLC